MDVWGMLCPDIQHYPLKGKDFSGSGALVTLRIAPWESFWDGEHADGDSVLTAGEWSQR